MTFDTNSNQVKNLLPSSRYFQVWDFHSSFGRILIRSCKYDGAENIDLIFIGVFYLEAPFGFHGLGILDPTETEIARLEERTGISAAAGKAYSRFYVLASEGARYYIGASEYTIDENSLDLMETSLGTRYALGVV